MGSKPSSSCVSPATSAGTQTPVSSASKDVKRPAEKGIKGSASKDDLEDERSDAKVAKEDWACPKRDTSEHKIAPAESRVEDSKADVSSMAADRRGINCINCSSQQEGCSGHETRDAHLRSSLGSPPSINPLHRQLGRCSMHEGDASLPYGRSVHMSAGEVSDSLLALGQILSPDPSHFLTRSDN